MAKQITDTCTLHNGIKMPLLGLGVYKMEDNEQAVDSIKHAVKVGYRSIDTAAIYKNETAVGKGIKESGVPREELFITTKVWNSDQGYQPTLDAFETSMKKLGLDYLDLYLIHWPVVESYKETWKAMEKLYEEGKVKAIGVCNFHQHHLEDLMKSAVIKPMVNQIELHPLLNQQELRDFCTSNEMAIEAWSPLARGRLLDHPLLVELAGKHGKTPAQMILRWDLQHGIITIPKSVTPRRIEENADLFDFELSPEEMKLIDEMNTNERTGQNPDNFHFDF
ncbi:aldo/keto reductase [Bacillus testis]|uniref:aldo/keto reductase n=1 Tax=Bacillus testis TaxID=1622072 RepID=UPI00067EED6C|nr:aldo/keto reductase [Bacillus testis]